MGFFVPLFCLIARNTFLFLARLSPSSFPPQFNTCLLLTTQLWRRCCTVWHSKAEITRVHVSVSEGVDMEARAMCSESSGWDRAQCCLGKLKT